MDSSDHSGAQNHAQMLVDKLTFARMNDDIEILSEEKNACEIEKDRLASEKQLLADEIVRLKATLAAVLERPDMADDGGLVLPETGKKPLVIARHHDKSLAKIRGELAAITFLPL